MHVRRGRGGRPLTRTGCQTGSLRQGGGRAGEPVRAALRGWAHAAAASKQGEGRRRGTSRSTSMPSDQSGAPKEATTHRLRPGRGSCPQPAVCRTGREGRLRRRLRRAGARRRRRAVRPAGGGAGLRRRAQAGGLLGPCVFVRRGREGGCAWQAEGWHTLWLPERAAAGTARVTVARTQPSVQRAMHPRESLCGATHLGRTAAGPGRAGRSPAGLGRAPWVGITPDKARLGPTLEVPFKMRDRSPDALK